MHPSDKIFSLWQAVVLNHVMQQVLYHCSMSLHHTGQLWRAHHAMLQVLGRQCIKPVCFNISLQHPAQAQQLRSSQI
jgi:hypothetical protein